MGTQKWEILGVLKWTVAVACYFLLSLGCMLMLRIIFPYQSLRDDVGFLEMKTDYLDNQLWKSAFYIHVFSSLFTLLAGFTQFLPSILCRRPTVHRWMGRFYAYNILLINFPATLLMGWWANGHWPARTAFLLLAVFWFCTTLQGVLSAKRRAFGAHRRWMIYSFALTLSALTLRTWKIILANSFDPNPLLLYQIDAWMGWVPNLLAAWLYLRLTNKRSSVVPAR